MTDSIFSPHLVNEMCLADTFKTSYGVGTVSFKGGKNRQSRENPLS